MTGSRDQRALVEIVRAALVDRMREFQGELGRVADSLMIGRTTVYRKVRELDIKPREWQVSQVPPLFPRI